METDDRTQCRGLLIILTLKKHLQGIWITRLVERLKQSIPSCSSFQSIGIETRTLEDWLAEGWLISEKAKDDGGQKIVGIVNRVSDAATPALFKACCALLAAAEASLQIPVWNGSRAYSLCGNKWRHHLLFRQAKLSSPTTMVYYTGTTEFSRGPDLDTENGKSQLAHGKIINIDVQKFRQNRSGRIDILIKPNAGGFGAGIRKISLPPPQTSSSVATHAKNTIPISIPASFTDDMALIQQYEVPIDGYIYRVWFLNGKVQCAVKRKVGGEEEVGDNTDGFTSPTEFTSGCAGGNLCIFPITKSIHKRTTVEVDHTVPLPQLPKASNLLPCVVPENVRQEIEDQLLPLLKDAHCGSVEFLYAPHKISNVQKSASCGEIMKAQSDLSSEPSENLQRLYFDLNLLSTLPIPENLEFSQNDSAEESIIWSQDFDPWLDLAKGIWDFIMTADLQMTES